MKHLWLILLFVSCAMKPFTRDFVPISESLDEIWYEKTDDFKDVTWTQHVSTFPINNGWVGDDTPPIYLYFGKSNDSYFLRMKFLLR